MSETHEGGDMKTEPPETLELMWAGMARRRQWLQIRMTICAVVLFALLAYPAALIEGAFGLPCWVFAGIGGGAVGLLIASGLNLASSVEREVESHLLWTYRNALIEIQTNNREQRRTEEEQ